MQLTSKLPWPLQVVLLIATLLSLLLILFISLDVTCDPDSDMSYECSPNPVCQAIQKPEIPIEHLNANDKIGNINPAASNKTQREQSGHFCSLPKRIKSNIEWVKVFISFLAAITAILAFAFPFYKNQKIKTIETLMTLEKDFREHLPFLLEIETNYDKHIRPVLEREVIQRNTNFNPTIKDKEILRKLDGVLRHYLICLKAKNHCVIDEEVVDSTYKFYLAMITDITWIEIDKKTNEKRVKPDCIARKELGAYVKLYWESIYKWAEESLGEPRQY